MSYLNTLKKHQALVLALLIVQAVVLGFAWSSGHVYTHDSFEYLQQAENILKEGHWSCGTASETAADKSLWSRRPPGYALFIIITSLGLNFPLLTLLLQGTLSVFNLTFAIHLFTITTKRAPPAILIAMFYLFFPSQFIYGAQYMTEIPFQTCLLGGTYFLSRFLEIGTDRNFLLQQFCWAGAYLLKPVAVFIWIPVLFYFLVIRRSAHHRTLFLSGALIHLLITGFIIMNNRHHSGVTEYSSIGTKLLLNYNLPSIIKSVVGVDACNRYMDSLQFELGTLDYASQRNIILQETIQQYTNHPGATFIAHGKGLIRFFLEPCRWDIQLLLEGMNPETPEESLGDVWKKFGVIETGKQVLRWNPVYLTYTVLTALSATGLLILFVLSLLNRTTPLRAQYLLAVLVIYIAVLTGPSASARFRLPVFPMMVIIAAAYPFKKPSEKNP